MRLGLAIPLFNEAELVTEVIASVQASLNEANIDHTLVLVDNGSTDPTSEIVDTLVQPGQIEVVHLHQNLGYGGGILAGLAHLEQSGMPEVVGWCWGDGQVTASVLPPLFESLKAGADLAKVERRERQDGLRRQITTSAYAATMRTLGISDRDINGCPKLMTKAAFEAIQPRSTDWFLDAETIIKAEALGLRVHQHPATMRARQAGKSKVKVRTVGEFAWNIARWRLTSNF